MANEKKPSRIEFHHQPPEERIRHFHEFTTALEPEEVKEQVSRCLTCGTPFCSSNCPLHNRPVDFNRFVRAGKWREAWDCLNSTNSFPEFTSRVCPRICEAGCMQYLMEDSAVGIQTIERAIIDRAWKYGWVKPEVPLRRTGKKVAVIGSGPAGLACAQQLARAGHSPTVYEKASRPGGLLALGMPDYKLPKGLIERRIEQMQAEGVKFRLGTAVGASEFDRGVHGGAASCVTADEVLEEYDAVVVAAGSETPRDLAVPGRDGKGVHFALDLLIAQNKALAGEIEKPDVSCEGCDVAVIGGGDTGSDCVGIARRQGAGKIFLIEFNPRPPETVDKDNTWPEWPRIFRTATAHEEGCERLFQVSTKEILLDESGAVRGISCVKADWQRDADSGRMVPVEVPDSAFEIPCQRVILSMGFLHPSSTLISAFGAKADRRGNFEAGIEGSESPFATSVPKLFACGDARSGQSLVVRAMSEGRRCAAAVDVFLTGRTELPRFKC